MKCGLVLKRYRFKTCFNIISITLRLYIDSKWVLFSATKWQKLKSLILSYYIYLTFEMFEQVGGLKISWFLSLFFDNWRLKVQVRGAIYIFFLIIKTRASIPVTLGHKAGHARDKHGTVGSRQAHVDEKGACGTRFSQERLAAPAHPSPRASRGQGTTCSCLALQPELELHSLSIYHDRFLNN